MTTYTWNTSSGTFTTNGDWTPSGVPGASDTAVFGTGTGTISGNDTVSALQLNSTGGPWSFSGNISADNFTINDALTLSGNPQTWQLLGSPTSGNFMAIGTGPGGVGSVTLSSNSVTITSSQTASTTNFAIYLGNGANATGTLTLNSYQGTLNTGPNGISVGSSGGTGILNLASNTSATFTSTNSSLIAALAVASSQGSSGTVNVNGNGALLTANGLVSVGSGGLGALTVTNYGSFTGGAAASSSGGAAAIDIGDSSAATSSPGSYGGSGTAQVTIGGTLTSLGNINIGLNGTTGSLTVTGLTDTNGIITNSVVLAGAQIQVGGGTIRGGGQGTLTVQNYGTVRAGTVANGVASVVIGGGMTGVTGTATVTGAGSLLNADGYRIEIGAADTGGGSTTGGAGTLTISNGGQALAGANYTDTEAALAVGAYAGGVGTLTITGANSELIAIGTAVIGGNNTGSGVTAGGTGTVSVTGGGLLQTRAMTIESGSSLTVDASSTLITPSITINGGTANLATLTAGTSISFGTGGTLDLHTVTGSNTIGNFAVGDVIDFVGSTAVTISGTTVSGGGGTINLGTAPSGFAYRTASDGNGGTQVSLTPQTTAVSPPTSGGVYRFFEKTNGTHFYTASQSEAAALTNPSSPTYRPDLVEETNAYGAYSGQVSGDTSEVQVYRFFDTASGTEFLTASASEAQGLMNPNAPTYRSDLSSESASNFYEDSTQRAGDIPVYRFFNSANGTHFYTGSPSEYAALTTPGAAGYSTNLTYEGIGFYAPAGTYST